MNTYTRQSDHIDVAAATEDSDICETVTHLTGCLLGHLRALIIIIRAFSVAGPQAWNQLPVSLRHTDSDCVATFKRHLKTLLFTAAYGVTDN